jgi:NADH dehydrogenase (ubiquinone) 1 alpha subcomplex subunit 9
LEDVHVEGTGRIVEAVAKYDVDRYIHVSSHSADPKSSSEFYATKVRRPQSQTPYHPSRANQQKGRAEGIARSVFPETTLVRPAPMFGFEDNLLLKLASALNLFTSNNMQEEFWPVHVSPGQSHVIAHFG